MTVIWWLLGVILVVLSFVVWVGGLKGKKGVLRIGNVIAPEPKEESTRRLRPVNIYSIIVGIVGVLVGLTVILFLAL